MTEEQKALDWWNSLSDRNKNQLITSVGYDVRYRLLDNTIIRLYNWVKSITPKDQL